MNLLGHSREFLTMNSSILYFPSGEQTCLFTAPNCRCASIDVDASIAQVENRFESGTRQDRVGRKRTADTGAAQESERSLVSPPSMFKPDGDDANAMLVCEAEIGGEPLARLLPGILERALKRLPIPKPMRWGDHDYAFVRPVHWLVLLHGDKVIDAEIFGIRSGRESRGHRFHHPLPVSIANPDAYVDALRAAKVLARSRGTSRARAR